MVTLVMYHIAFGAHADISPLGCGSPFIPAMSLSKGFILLLKFMLAISSGLPYIYQVVIALSWVFLAFLSFMLAPWLWVISHIAWACLMSNQEEPFPYLLHLDHIFYWEETFPQVSLSCTYILTLSIGMFHYLELVFLSLDTRLLLVCNYKPLLFFFKLFNIFEKVQKT